MSNNSPRWEPGSNAVHRLIQLLDVLAISFNRFRQKSFHLPTHNPPQPFDTASWQEGRSRLLGEFNAVRDAFYIPYTSPFHRAARLADEAIAEFARSGALHDSTTNAVKEVAQWLGLVGTSWQVGKARPWDYGSWTPRYYTPEAIEDAKQREDKFDEEGRLLAQYTFLRRGLLSALAGIGRTVPPEIDRRAALAHHPWPEGGTDPITQERLLAMVQETEPCSETTTATAPSETPAAQSTEVSIVQGPGFCPAAPERVPWTVRQLLRWTEETARRKALPKERRYPRDVDPADTFRTANRYLQQNAPEYWAWLEREWPNASARPVPAILYLPSPDQAPGAPELRTHAFAIYRTDFTPETIRAMIGDLARALRQTADDVMAMTLDRAAASFDSVNETLFRTVSTATGTGGAPTTPGAEPPCDPDTAYTVADARDLLRNRREENARMQAILDKPMLLLQAAVAPILPDMEKVRVALALRDPTPPRMLEEAAAGSAVFALLANAARQECGRELDEDALAAMVSRVAIQSGRLPAEVWQLALAEFARLKWPDLSRREATEEKQTPTGEEKTQQPTGASKSQSVAALLTAADTAGLIGKEAKVVKIIADHGGKVSIPNAEILCEGDALSAFKRAKPKIKKVGWNLYQRDNHLCAVAISPKGRK
jgi:hypothetical protein